jgi:hypothetical protein
MTCQGIFLGTFFLSLAAIFSLPAPHLDYGVHGMHSALTKAQDTKVTLPR